MKVAGRKKLYLIGAISCPLLITTIFLMSGENVEDPPRSLDSRTKYLADALIQQDQPSYDRVVERSGLADAGEFYQHLQDDFPDVFRNPQLRIDYEVDTKFENPSQGKACTVLKIVPGNRDLARKLSEDASSLDWQTVLYWSFDPADGWRLNGEKTLKAYRLDNVTKWTGRAADKKTFKQVNK